MSSLTSVPPTIVSITPLAVRSDSRTLKQASSVARLGYRSIVVEGMASKLDRSRLLFELLSVPAPPPRFAQTKDSLPTKRRALRHYRKAAKHALDHIRAQIDQRFAVCSYMESDIGDAFEQLAGEPRLAEFVAGVAEARAAVLAFKTRIQPWRLETAADWRVLEIAACGTRNDSVTFTDDNLRHASGAISRARCPLLRLPKGSGLRGSASCSPAEVPPSPLGSPRSCLGDWLGGWMPRQYMTHQCR
jgi:hypothetical protein